MAMADPHGGRVGEVGRQTGSRGVITLRDVVVGVRGTLAEWLRLRWNDLHFTQARTTLLVFAVLLAISLLMLLARGLRSREAGRTHIGLPAILPAMRRSYLPAMRHAAFLLFLLGVPFFAVALADPHTSFTREEVSYPGRRIAILIDGSSSMTTKFETKTLRAQDTRAYYTNVAAAERFMKLRMTGPYHDLVALIEFGNQAYVVTPFTTDYENVLLSIRLVGDPKNWGRFDDSGTTILRGIDQGTQLFKSFDFLEASGNLMVIFTDGRDDEMMLGDKRMDEIMAGARRARIPLYMIRTAFNMQLGDVKEDKIWKPAVESTGGRFYPAANEQTLLSVIREIDKLAAGRIETVEYTVQRPRFGGYVLIAIALWLTAAVLKLGFRHFRSFP
jgi:VWA domain-containing protein